MLGGPNDPALVAYAITCLVLSVNLLGLWVYSGAVRAKTKIAINTEDGARYKAPLSELDPPEVARVLRAHANAQATIYPFLLLGLVFVLAHGAAWIAATIFATFTAARIAHSIFYLAARQPGRTLAFVVGLLATITLMVAVIWLLAVGTAGR
jgi:prostaglandin-E synthase 1